MVSSVVRALLVFAALAAPSAARAGGIDVETDMSEEHSDNYRSLVSGIQCGACKAITREISDVFDAVAAKHKRDAGPTNVFGSRYVSLFAQTLTKEITTMCGPEGAIELEWGFSVKGADNVLTTSRVFDRFGVNLTKEESSTIQMTVYGLGVFTKDAKERFYYNGPPGSEIQGSENFSMLSNTYQKGVLREACAAVTESLEFDEYLEKATKNLDEGFDFSAQHVLCLDLGYCKVKQPGAKRSKARKIEQKYDQESGNVVYEVEGDGEDPEFVHSRRSARSERSTESEL